MFWMVCGVKTSPTSKRAQDFCWFAMFLRRASIMPGSMVVRMVLCSTLMGLAIFMGLDSGALGGKLSFAGAPGSMKV